MNIRKPRRRFRVMSFIAKKPSLLIVIGLTIGQGLVYLATPLISRLYEAGDIGTGQLFLVGSTFIGSIGILRMDQRVAAAPLAQIGPIVQWSLLLAILSATLGAAAWAVATDSGWLSTLAFAVAALSLALTPLGSQLASREKSYGSIAASRGLAGVAQAATQVTLGSRGLTGSGIPLGYAVGYLAGLAPFLWLNRRYPFRHHRGTLSRRFWALSVMLTATTVLSAIAVASPTLVLGWLFTRDDLGEFALAYRLTAAPAGLVVAAVAPVIAGVVGERLRAKQPYKEVIVSHLRVWLPAALILLVGLVLIPPIVYQILLGPEWAGVAEYGRALSPMIAALVAAGPITQVLMLRGYAKMQLALDGARVALLSAVALSAQLMNWSPIQTTTVLSLVFLVTYAAYVGVALRTSDS